MNRITRIAAIALTLVAAGSAMAESIDAGGRLPQTTASSAPLAVVMGATHDFDFVDQPTASVRSRAEVRAETQAAIADGSLNVHGEAFAQRAPAAKDVRHVAQLSR